MKYRVLPHGGEKIGIIGMGSSVIGAQPEEEIIATVRAAYESGVNYFDMAGGHAAIFDAYGKALEGIRDKVYLQIHFGADYTSGDFGIGGEKRPGDCIGCGHCDIRCPFHVAQSRRMQDILAYFGA